MSDPLIWVLIPYFIEDGRLDGETFENEDTKTELAQAFHSLGMPWIWQPVVLANIDNVVSQIKRYRQRRPVIVFNFCDGLDSDGSPGPSVVRALEAAGIPFTGADSQFYDISTSKLRMKKLFRSAGVSTSPYQVLPDEGPVRGACKRLGAPVIVKPEISAASVGISLRSRVFTDAEIAARRDELKNNKTLRHFATGKVFAEHFVDGREFTVFLVGDWRQPDKVRCFPPAERVFDSTLPASERFLSFDRYWDYYREETVPPSGKYFFQFEAVGPDLAPALSDLALRAFCAVRGVSYGRVDIRMESTTGELFVLEVNANPEVTDERQTTTGYILEIAGVRFPELLGMFMEDVLARETK